MYGWGEGVGEGAGGARHDRPVLAQAGAAAGTTQLYGSLIPQLVGQFASLDTAAEELHDVPQLLLLLGRPAIAIRYSPALHHGIIRRILFGHGPLLVCLGVWW
jgi:hypothetical protein